MSLKKQAQKDEANDPLFQETVQNYVGPTQWLYAKNQATNSTMLFCWIQNVASAQFKQVFRNLVQVKGYANMAPKVHPTWIENYARLLIQPSIHKFVFYREPLSRFLSGYLGQCQGSNRHYCRLVFGSENTTFSEAVHFLADRDQLDLHGFAPQTQHCGGLISSNNRTQTVFTSTAQLTADPVATRSKMQRMLQSTFNDLTDQEFDWIYPAANTTTTAVEDHDALMQQNYQDPRLVGIVVKYFLQDYIAFQIQPPEFARQALLELFSQMDPFALGIEDMWKLGIATPPPMELEIESTGSGRRLADYDGKILRFPSQPLLELHEPPMYYLLFAICFLLLRSF